MYNIVMPTFREYLLSKLQEYEKEQGQRITLDKFADYLGVKRPILSLWLSGKNKPSLDSVKRLSEKLGNEIYDVLQLPNRNQYLQRIYDAFENIPPEKQQKLAEEAEEYVVKNERSKRSSARRKTSEN